MRTSHPPGRIGLGHVKNAAQDAALAIATGLHNTSAIAAGAIRQNC